ncbi:MAG: hypothetical protein L6R41_004149 [Letrouitia leprolyta]|nr:MAG: hypothetical protein L6R41_004149 [Letrouitia leprolyta]
MVTVMTAQYTKKSGASIDAQWYCPPEVGALHLLSILIKRGSNKTTHIEANSPIVVKIAMLPMKEKR